LNERLGQFIGLVEYGRTLDATARACAFDRLAVQPDSLSGSAAPFGHHPGGALSGISRQNANQCLRRLERDGLLRLEYGGVTIIDLERLRAYGE
jgi:CRP/FNR family transcriptional regulator, cyclic AMP receptor protein